MSSVSVSTGLTLPFGQAVDRELLQDNCIKGLAKFLNCHKANLVFVPLEDSTKGTICLRGSAPVAVNELSEKKSRPLIRMPVSLPVSTMAEYWFGFTLNYSNIEPGVYCVESANIVIARSTISENIDAILRAEWGYYPGEEDGEKHGQPHWHIYRIRVNDTVRMLEVLESYSGNVPVQDFAPDSIVETPGLDGEDGEVELERFHFAMSARWTDNLAETRLPMDESNVVSWLLHCLSYIRDQLVYVHRKQKK